MTYLGVSEPEKAFAKFKDTYADLCEMRLKCKPMSDDYMAVCALIHQMESTAQHFTKNEFFYSPDISPVDPRSPR